jgi:hypothetical protein
MEPLITTLPENFDGNFYFTNWSDEEFTGMWGGKAYTYEPNKTSKMVIIDATPLEVQSIRKKFAKEFAEREYFKSPQAKKLEAGEKTKEGDARFNSFKQAGIYTLSDLGSYIQRCLDPLPMANQIISDVAKENIEDKLSRDEDGELHTIAVRPKQSLKLKDKN